MSIVQGGMDREESKALFQFLHGASVQITTRQDDGVHKFEILVSSTGFEFGGAGIRERSLLPRESDVVMASWRHREPAPDSRFGCGSLRVVFYSHYHYRTCRIILTQCQRQPNTRKSCPTFPSASSLSMTPSAPLWVNDYSCGGTFSAPLSRSTKIDRTSQETGDVDTLQMRISIVMSRAIVTRGRDPNDMDNREASNNTLKSTHRE
jgi:hypothetical protein